MSGLEFADDVVLSSENPVELQVTFGVRIYIVKMLNVVARRGDSKPVLVLAG